MPLQQLDEDGGLGDVALHRFVLQGQVEGLGDVGADGLQFSLASGHDPSWVKGSRTVRVRNMSSG